MNAIRIAFEAVVGVGNGFIQPVDNLAAVTRSGHPVEVPRGPYRILFEPVGGYPFPADCRRDFREDLDTVSAGTISYRVMGMDGPDCAEKTYMGTLVTRSEFVASSYGDTRLFFKHNARFLKP